MDFKKIRENSLVKAKSLGYETNPNLPLLGENISIRPFEEIIDRNLALFAVVACSFGFSKKFAISWLKKERIYESLTFSERCFLAGESGDVLFIQSQVEALCAFAWSLGVIKSLEFDQVCENNLIKLFPDIKNNGSSQSYKAKAKLRNIESIVMACDLSYCLHWGIVQENFENKVLSRDVGVLSDVQLTAC